MSKKPTPPFTSPAHEALYQILGDFQKAHKQIAKATVKPSERRKALRGKAFELPDPLCIVDFGPLTMREYMAQPAFEDDEFEPGQYKPWIGRQQ